MNIKKCIIPPPKPHDLLKCPQTENGKLYFSPTFQKVELRNSTFFQWDHPANSGQNHDEEYARIYPKHDFLLSMDYENLVFNICKNVLWLYMKYATKNILQKTWRKCYWKINLTYHSKIKHSKATHFCIVYASTHILTYPILGTT